MVEIRLSSDRAPEAVESTLDAIEAHLVAAGAAEPEVMQMRLVAEEIVTNIARCAWPEGVDAQFHVELAAETREAGLHVSMTTIDDGVAFDPTAQAEPDIEASLDDRGIGGLGMFLVREMTDAQRYERENGENRFRVERLLPRG
ncbi:ATP-binding protein [Roseomonas frigidaquae]|uniref:ATP-binding protein n=1 Tax=Falsiroseomonas frigidaquae TaxID=487318 RepID=A0ABX1EUD8_9PROT|nr:ATP-binding protein [Falsiroseomonas frigidaquae]NKE43713.1 ATP-binding protein [Falsiroseomonas frigidaquae]